MMLKRSVLYILLMCTINVPAQDFKAHWVSYPVPDSTAEVWFQQIYTVAECPSQASVMVASTGNFELYVNQRNVSTDVLIPYRTTKSDVPIAVTYDVTRFLRKGNNTIAVWYSPSYPHINSRQISVSYYGITPQGKYFAYNSGSDWLCRQANFRLNSCGNECVDGTKSSVIWNTDRADLACWLPVAIVSSLPNEHITHLTSPCNGMKIARILKPVNDYAEGDSAYYDFDKGFRGWIRVTIRGTKRGEMMNIGGLNYVCNGTTDEQAYQKFTIDYYRNIMICGDINFKPEQIQKVEGLMIGY